MESVRKITGSDMKVEPGEVVYRLIEKDAPGWKLPLSYKNHPDQNDYNHVGVIISVNPMVIFDCTKVTKKKINGIRIDNN